MPSPIIVGVDLLEPNEGRDALLFGGRIAASLGATVQAVHVFTPCGDLPRQRRYHEQRLETLLDATEVPGVATAFTGMKPAYLLHHLADRERAAGIVVGSGHGGAHGRTSVGPVAEGLLHGSMVPVTVVPREFQPRSDALDRIGVAVAGTPESDAALEQARAFGGVLTAIAAEDPAPLDERGLAAQRLERAMRAGGEGAIGMVAEGDAAPALAEAADALGLDLLVAGSRSYGPLHIVLLGAVTRRLLGLARCPVMVVPRLRDAAHDIALVGGMEAALDS